ncbi:hypothetical protein DFH06DRAFT_1206287 [Mycena polygramma]|nr:hypothetical protein DFH06DRAFT_1206287 [Mycena polygramma]
MAAVCDSCGQCNMWTLSSESPVEPPSEYSSVQLRSKLDEVTAEIVRHRAYMNVLEDKRRELEMQLARIVYPVLSIPPEILSQIFFACLPSHGRVRPSPLTPPLTLAQVCSYWREIALSSCQLWSSLDLLIPYNYDGTPRKYWDSPDGKSYINRMRGMRSLQETWFARAKEHSLSLTIRSLDQGGYQLSPMFYLAAGRAHRLELTLPDKDLRLLGMICPAFPHLKHLAILPHGSCSSSSLSVLPDAPVLSELRLGDVPALMTNLSPLLTTLELQQISIETLFDALKQCPQLLHLTAHMKQSHSGQTMSIAEIALPLLQSLILHGSDIESLNVPSLRRLELYKQRYARRRYITFPPRSLFDSNPALEHLGLASGVAWEFIECLRRSPSLTSLLVHVDDHISWFAEVMDRVPPLVPHLATLTIHATFHALFDYSDFIHLVQTRRNPTSTAQSPLDSVRLYLHEVGWAPRKDWVLPRGTITQLRPLLDKGLDLRVIYNDTHGWPDADFCESFP